MRAADVHAIKMGDATVSLGDVDVLELDVHVVFGLDEFAAVSLAGVDLDCDLMSLCDHVSWGSGCCM